MVVVTTVGVTVTVVVVMVMGGHGVKVTRMTHFDRGGARGDGDFG